MTRQHPTRSSIVRRLRLSPDRFAAAAALQDPNLLFQLQAAQSHGERPTNPPRSSTPLRRRRGALVSTPGALKGETGGALLLGLLTNAYEPRAQGPAAISPNDRPELRGTALSAGIGFTVSLLIASRAFDGALLDQAKVGIPATALLAPALAVAALGPLRRRDGAAPVRRGYRPAAMSPCPAQ